MTLSPGRVVHVRIGGTDEAPELRPCTVVKVWGPDCFNGQMLLDGSNDAHHITEARDTCASFDVDDCKRGLRWVASICEGTEIGQWRWPSRT